MIHEVIRSIHFRSCNRCPENPRFHVDSHSTSRDDNKSSSHAYTYHDHEQIVYLNHAHKEPISRGGLKGKHHSYISFVTGHYGDEHRTGEEGVKSASQNSQMYPMQSVTT